MMRKFMDEDFLLTTATSKKLFHSYAQNCPVIDYNSWLSAADIFRHRTFRNLAELWIDADPDKQQMMLNCGVDEFYVTGVAPDYEKFLKLAEIMPKLIGSPVYHLTHMELQRYFGIHMPLDSETALEIWHKTGEMMAKDGFDAVSMLAKANVKVLSTVDDPADDLEWNLRCAYSENIPTAVIPSFVPDRLLDITDPAWFSAITELGARYGTIHNWESFKSALGKAVEFFCQAGCRFAVHNYDIEPATGAPDAVIEKMIHDGAVAEEDVEFYQSAVIDVLLKEYEKHGLKVIGLNELAYAVPVERGVRGISNQIDLMMETGRLAGSVGMLTDSCSFASFVRHEYYRRILCEKIGQLVESGHYPADIEFLGEMVQDICWRNAAAYFGFEV